MADPDMTDPDMADPDMTVRDGWAANADIRLRWEQHTAAGATVPLLMVNGLGVSMVSFDERFVAELGARGLDVVRFDNRDAGRSSPSSGPYELADMAADALAVMDDVGWSSAHVFGQSLGGMIVQQLAIQAPERVRSITSVMSATGNPAYGRASRAARGALLTRAPVDRDGWLEHRAWSEQHWRSPDGWDEAGARARAERMFDYGVQPDRTKHQYRAVLASGSREDVLAHVQIPTLVLHGSLDTLVDPSGGRRTAEIMPMARYVEIEGMGHDLPPPYWARIAELVAAHTGAAPPGS